MQLKEFKKQRKFLSKKINEALKKYHDENESIVEDYVYDQWFREFEDLGRKFPLFHLIERLEGMITPLKEIKDNKHVEEINDLLKSTLKDLKEIHELNEEKNKSDFK